MAEKPTTSSRKRAADRPLRDKLARKLPAMLDAAIAAYQQIASSADGADPKTFAAAHTGAKAALAHIEQIIKLAEAAIEREATSPGTLPSQDRIEALIRTARGALLSGEE
ncbi:hypothetical protein HH303_12055 [Rhodospirillaceae bacterium KN72]|uniref:Uncharacterized protein n=1 Tax=Pacificispira spongiicola TaxID=2729598 RepID=A0A7Y0HGR4_9PROT|nr:hypothetical protein [Pacificispira spongiicola]NMM45217.1 hypothetical protein [Pacificispira spongiicola]